MKKSTQLFRIFLALCVLSPSGAAQMSASQDTMNPSDYAKAAQKNSVLKNALKWKWGKAQTGWGIYVPLIKNTLETEFGPETPEFASGVAEWQKSKGIKPTGEVNLETLFSFIHLWQSRRIKPVYEAKSHVLLDAPIKDFYDQTRSISLLKVDKTAYEAYKSMIEAAGKDLEPDNLEGFKHGKYLKIVSAYRSPEYQAALREREPGLNRAQLAFRSPHFTGRALDLYVGGDPVSTQDANRKKQIATREYLWLVENAAKFGFYPYFYEPWHWEYLGKVED